METTACTQCGKETTTKLGRLCHRHWLELLLRYEVLLNSKDDHASDLIAGLFSQYAQTKEQADKKMKKVKGALES